VLADEVARGPLEAWLTAAHSGAVRHVEVRRDLDGPQRAADGTSRWVTGEQSRADVHRLRREVDAVVAGVGTVLADDPLLTTRPDPGHQPLRVVVDSAGRTPLTARALSGQRPAVVAVRSDVEAGTYPDQLSLPGDDDGHVDLLALLAALQARDVVSVLLEGGPDAGRQLRAAWLVDRVVGYVAPALLGDGPPALQGAGVGTIAAAHRLRLDDVTRTGDDVRAR
jgi:diaminohydroxyphosphoribosylaminopyrimidine deaminase/5-amino-6-(5-phosphoribosylamino)uracil reductase